MPANISCSRNVSREPRKNGLKTRIRCRKSIASEDDPGYFCWRLARGVSVNYSRYSSAFESEMKFLSASVGVPMIWKMRESWSFEQIGKPLRSSVTLFDGERGKQDLPGKSALRSKNVGAFSLIMLRSSAKMHPMPQISTGGP